MGGVSVLPVDGVDTIAKVEPLVASDSRGDVQDTGRKGVKGERLNPW